MKKELSDRYYFSLDGALLNAQADIIECLQAAITAQAGSTSDENQFTELYRANWGKNLLELLAVLSGCEHACSQKIATEYAQLCAQRGFVKTRVTEDMHELLHLLNRNGCHLHCVSSYIPDPDTLLREKSLHQYFQKITNTMGCRTEFWQQQLETEGLPGACIVSDRTVDLRFGVANKSITAGVTWGASDMWDIGIETPDVILTSALECKRFFIDGVLP